MKVIFTQQALDAINSIYTFTTTLSDKKTAKWALELIYKTLEVIKEFPNIGKVGEKNNIREFVMNKIPYVIVYKIMDDKIYILAITHTSRSGIEDFF